MLSLNGLSFSNVLLDDMHAIDEVVDAFGPAIEHLYLDLPDRWFTWDPPETNIGTFLSLIITIFVDADFVRT